MSSRSGCLPVGSRDKHAGPTVMQHAAQLNTLDSQSLELLRSRLTGLKLHLPTESHPASGVR